MFFTLSVLFPGVAAATCGDGVRDAGEACDDSNLIDGDGCQSDCTQTWPCGNGVVDVHPPYANEMCDQNDPVPAYGQTTGCTICTDQCIWNSDACRFCGDGDTDYTDGETCDDGNTANGDGCDSGCQEECACGDGHVNGNGGCGEVCDDGNQSAGDGCSSTCHDECDGAIVVTLEDTWIQAGSSQTVVGLVTNSHPNVACDTFLTPLALDVLVVEDRSGTPSWLEVPANTSVPISFEIGAPWNAPGYYYIGALGHSVDWRPFYVLTSPEGLPLPGDVFAGTACVLPAAEESVAYRWDTDINLETVYDFRAKIQPSSASFQDRMVDEEEFSTETVDTCYFPGSFYLPSDVPGNMGRGIEWIVQGNNLWGPSSPAVPPLPWHTPSNADGVGVLPDAAAYYQVNGPNAGNCGVTFIQHMKMYCERLRTYEEYTSHQVGWSVTATTFTAFRDQMSKTKPW